MAKTTKSFLALLRGGNLGVPLVILCILAMVILPLPPALLDILFTFNIVLAVYTLNNELENLLTNVVNQAQQAGKVMLDSVPVDPNMLNQFQSTMPQVKEQMKAAGKAPVLLVPPQLRPLLARYARLFAPGLHVLSYNEVPDELELKIMGALS
jgi:flagellar biosynthesis component FlhA